MFDQPRLHRRFALRITALVELDGAPPVKTTTVDLSLGGVCLRFERDLRPGTRITVSLALPHQDQRLRLAAEVRHSTAVVAEGQGPHERGVYIVGVAFTELAADERAALERFLATLAERSAA